GGNVQVFSEPKRTGLDLDNLVCDGWCWRRVVRCELVHVRKGADFRALDVAHLQARNKSRELDFVHLENSSCCSVTGQHDACRLPGQETEDGNMNETRQPHEASAEHDRNATSIGGSTP